MKNGQNLKIITLPTSIVPSTPLDVVQGIYRPFTIIVFIFLQLLVQWPCLSLVTPQEIPPLFSTIYNQLPPLIACAYHLLLYLSVYRQLFVNLPLLLSTIKDWLLPSYGSQQHNAPKATEGETSLFYVLKEMQKYYRKEASYLYITNYSTFYL